VSCTGWFADDDGAQLDVRVMTAEYLVSAEG